MGRGLKSFLRGTSLSEEKMSLALRSVIRRLQCSHPGAGPKGGCREGKPFAVQARKEVQFGTEPRPTCADLSLRGPGVPQVMSPVPFRQGSHFCQRFGLGSARKIGFIASEEESEISRGFYRCLREKNQAVEAPFLPFLVPALHRR